MDRSSSTQLRPSKIFELGISLCSVRWSYADTGDAVSWNVGRLR
jgi:hypothetical protein